MNNTKLFIILGNQLFNPKFFEKYKEHINLAISESDKGIYDAFNKGLDLEIISLIVILALSNITGFFK